jgi:hypothetical protein
MGGLSVPVQLPDALQSVPDAPVHVLVVCAWAATPLAKNAAARSAYRTFRSPLNNAGVLSEFLEIASFMEVSTFRLLKKLPL